MKKAELEIKYKNALSIIDTLRYKLNVANSNSEEYERKYLNFKSKYNEIHKYMHEREAKESDVLRENKWLKDTLRLVIIPGHRKFKVKEMMTNTFEERIWE